MKTIYITLRTLVCMLCLTGIFTACTEGNEWETNPSKAALFRVRDVKVDKAAAQTASVSWSATSSAEYYIIEVSTEKLSDNMEMGTAQNSIVYGEDKSISTVPALISGLTKSSTYYLRVKSFGDGLESGWAYLDGTFETTEEDILEKKFANGDITAESIRVKWNDAGLPVTHLSYDGRLMLAEMSLYKKRLMNFLPKKYPLNRLSSAVCNRVPNTISQFTTTTTYVVLPKLLLSKSLVHLRYWAAI